MGSMMITRRRASEQLNRNSITLKLANLKKMRTDGDVKQEKRSVALTESFIIQEAFLAGFKTLSDKKSMDSDNLRDAINKERPFKELYQNLMWLNHYAITNIMAIEFALNKFQNNVFMAAPEFNLLIQNFVTVLNNTELKKNEDLSLSYLDDITRDLVKFYATFFTKGDKK